VCVALSGSCSLLAPSAVEARKETLTKVPAELPHGKTHPGTLLVLAPEAGPLYDTVQMAYQIRPYEIAYFSQTEWAERPPLMLHPLLVRTLQDGACFSTVVTPPFMGHYTHALRTQILTLLQDFTAEPPTLQLTLRFQLITAGGDEPVATREISIHEPMREKSPYAGAVAANDATAKALREVAEFVQAQVG
jgi:cholesterol transport system auxiliary component